MNATLVPFTSTAEQEAAIARVADHLRHGGLIACPTETVYGFGCMLQEPALAALAALKQRPAEKAFLLLVSDASMVPGVSWTTAARALAGAFWPGPVTLALPAPPGVFPARVLDAGRVAVRSTAHAGMRMLIETLGAALTSTSANAPGREPARSAQQVAAVLAGQQAAVDVLVLDGGTLPPSAPSTIVDCSVDPPRIVRTGAVTEAEIAEIIHGIATRKQGV